MYSIWEIRMEVDLFEVVFVSKINAVIIRNPIRMITALWIKYGDR